MTECPTVPTAPMKQTVPAAVLPSTKVVPLCGPTKSGVPLAGAPSRITVTEFVIAQAVTTNSEKNNFYFPTPYFTNRGGKS